MNKNFSFLGLAKKANALLIGQDNVLFALKERCELFILVSNDVSSTLLRKIQAKTLSSNVTIINTDLSRGEMGTLLGIHSSSIVAIKKDNTFAEKIRQIETL